MRLLWLDALVAAVLVVFAQAGFAAEWIAVSSSQGTPVARLETGDVAIPFIILTCDGKRVGMGIQASADANLRALELEFAAPSGKRIKVTLARNEGAVNYVGYLADGQLLDAIVSGGKIALTVRNRPIAFTHAGGAQAFATALRQCYASAAPTAQRAATAPPGGSVGGPSIATPIPESGHAPFEAARLPQVLREDLAEFERSCDFAYDDAYDLKPGARRGPALAAPGAIQTADFNGDGQADYLLDTSGLRCTRPLEDALGLPFAQRAYVSQPDGRHLRSFDGHADDFAILAAQGEPARAALFLHRDYVPADPDAIDGEGDDVPERDETVGTANGLWSPSEIGEPVFAQLAETYPPAMRDLFAQWRSGCEAVGSWLNVADPITETSDTYGDDGNLAASRPLDLNGDGRVDYVIDTDQISCGMWELPRRPGQPPFCGSDCVLVAIISGPGGGYVVDRVKKSETLIGNGDPNYLFAKGRRDVLRIYNWRAPGAADSPTCIMQEVSWSGTTEQRQLVSCEPE